MSRELIDFAFGDQEHLLVETLLTWEIFKEIREMFIENGIQHRVIRKCKEKRTQRLSYQIINPMSNEFMQRILDAPDQCVFFIVNRPELYKTLVAWDNAIQNFEPFQLEHLIQIKRDGCEWKDGSRTDLEELFKNFTQGQIEHLSTEPILTSGRKFVELSLENKFEML